MSGITINNLLNSYIKNRFSETDLYGRHFRIKSKENRSETLKKACEDFEALFVAQLMKEMRETIPESGLMDGGQAEEIYMSLLDTHLSHEIASSGSLGLAKQLYEQLSKIGGTEQEGDVGPPTAVNKDG